MNGVGLECVGEVVEDMGCDCPTCTCDPTYQARVTVYKDGKRYMYASWGGFATRAEAETSLKSDIARRLAQHKDHT